MLPHNCPQVHGNDKGRSIAYATYSGVFQTFATLAVILRLYSRVYLTRSAGSDDLMIVLAVAVTVPGTVTDIIASVHGFGRHCADISSYDFMQAEKWTYIGWMIAFLGFFFLRSSIMLFTLRLLPRVKKRSTYTIYFAFVLNLAITIVALVGFGVTCQPFSGLWTHSSKSSCVNPEVLASTQQANAILSCVVDIMTATIPALLLWKVHMKRKTKIILDVLFCLGLVTAALSIGRAASGSAKYFTTDSTYHMLTPLSFTLFESKVGILLACGPALRQLWVHTRRTGTLRPSSSQQMPNGDFEKMRHRVNVRDWFWRGKQDPLRAHGLINAERRHREHSTYTSNDISAKVDPEDSPLSVIEHRIVTNQKSNLPGFPSS